MTRRQTDDCIYIARVPLYFDIHFLSVFFSLHVSSFKTVLVVHLVFVNFKYSKKYFLNFFA